MSSGAFFEERLVSGQRGGFSLSEVLVGLALLGVLAAAGASSLHDMLPSVRADRAARGIAGLLEWVRWKAVQEGLPFKIVLDSTENRVTVYREKTGPKGTVEEQVRALEIQEAYPGVVLGAASEVPRTSGCAPADRAGVHFLQRRFRFLPSGTSDRCGSFYLIPAKDLPDRRDRMRAVSLLLATGRLQLWAYDPAAGSTCGGQGAWRPIF